jgi:transposase
MAFRELTMIDVREVLRRWSAGQSARRTAQGSGTDRKTVTRYVEAARACGVVAGSVIDDAIVARVAAHVQARETLPPSEAWSSLLTQQVRIEAWLAGERPLRLVRIHELLARDGIDVGYTTLRRFASDVLGWRKPKVTLRLDDPPPGQEAQIDFGHVGWINVADGKRRKLWALIVTLSFSRHMFVWPTLTQTVVDVCAGLDAAWRFFGGVPKHVIPDNASSMIVRADPLSPVFHRAFGEYVQARGFFTDPARVRRPQDKGRVENQVPYVRERCFDGESLGDDLAAIREHAARWCRDVAGTRVHGTTREVPLVVFEQQERSALSPAPLAPFDVPLCGKAKVHRDHFAQVARGLYSLPTMHIGKVLDYRADARTVHFYEHAQLIKTHARVAPGKRAVDVRDFPADKANYAFRNVDALKTAAYGKDRNVGTFVERLLVGPTPWIKMRQVQALLRLCDRYGSARVAALCARALAFDVLDVRRIEGMLKRALQIEGEAEGRGKLIPLPARFARDTASFATTRKDTTSREGGAQ